MPILSGYFELPDFFSARFTPRANSTASLNQELSSISTPVYKQIHTYTFLSVEYEKVYFFLADARVYRGTVIKTETMT